LNVKPGKEQTVKILALSTEILNEMPSYLQSDNKLSKWRLMTIDRWRRSSAN